MGKSRAEELALLPVEQRQSILSRLTSEQLEELRWDWSFWGRPEQQLPPGDWFVWLMLAGRGFGKTRTATENIARMLRGPSPLIAPPGAPRVMSIIGDTPFDLRQYQIEGPSGLCHVGPPDYRPIFEPSKKLLTWPNGCYAMLFSAEDPETLRGASGSFFWWDELCKAKRAEEAWSNLLFGIREGNPRGIVTTTPRPTDTLKNLVAEKGTHVTRGSTYDNKANLSPKFFRNVIAPLKGTKLGLQEVEGEIVDWSGDAFFQPDYFLVDGRPVPMPQNIDYVFAVIDTALKTGRENDGTAVVYCGRSQYLGSPLVYLDWDILQIDGALLQNWLPSVLSRCIELADLTKARMGTVGAFIEDKGSGTVLLQHATMRGWPVEAIPSDFTALGKDERAFAVSPAISRGEVKISQEAFDKRTSYKGETKNHFWSQITGFRIADKDAAKRSDDLLDCGVYGVSIGLGNSSGF